MQSLPSGSHYKFGHFSGIDETSASKAIELLNWHSMFDTQLTDVILSMLSHDFVMMAEVLDSARGMKSHIMQRLARLGLTSEDFSLYRRLEEFSKPVTELRNGLAHRTWGYSNDHPDHLLLGDWSYAIRKKAERRAARGGAAEGEVSPLQTDQWIWLVSRQELDRAIHRARRCNSAAVSLRSIVEDPTNAAQSREELRASIAHDGDPELGPRV